MRRQADIRIHALHRRLEALPAYRGVDGPSRAGLDAEWPDALDRLQGLHTLAVDGVLQPDQIVRYRQLLRLFESCADILQELGLTQPPSAISQWLAEHSEPAALADSA